MDKNNKNEIIDKVNIAILFAVIALVVCVLPIKSIKKSLFEKNNPTINSKNPYQQPSNTTDNNYHNANPVEQPQINKPEPNDDNKNTSPIKDDDKVIPSKKEPAEVVTTESRKELGPDKYTSSIKSNKFLVKYNPAFVPDKYNTGVDRTKRLTVFNIDNAPRVNGLLFVSSPMEDGVAAILSKWKNPSLSGEYVIENYDFSNYYVKFYDFVDYSSNVRIIFRNCSFNNMDMSPEPGTLSVVFENCDFAHVSGSNALFENCKFGISSMDAINPFKNVTVRNSYIGDLGKFTTKGLHLDGVQIYAKAGIIASNIHFYNTRFDTPNLIPCIDGTCSSAYVNAPLMLQLEYDDGDNITFEKLHINGGGFSIYTHAVKGTKYSNVLFKDISIGYGMVYGNIYHGVTEEGLTMINVGNINRLFIGSVWKDHEGVHISTTNYTLVERKLTCATNVGTYSFTIPAHPKITRDTTKNYRFDEMPYDINNIIKSSRINNVKCYDTTEVSNLTKNNLLIDYSF